MPQEERKQIDYKILRSQKMNAVIQLFLEKTAMSFLEKTSKGVCSM
jgi:hypothetical protein